MAQARYLIAGFMCLAATSSGCGAALGPPAELLGLWSAGPAACAAGVGLNFENNVIAARFHEDREVLFEQPIYRREGAGEHFRVRIDYQLPTPPGGVRAVGAYGAITLARGEDGRLHPVSHVMVDPRTGSMRMRIKDDRPLEALDLTPCDRHPWTLGLRGREAV